MKAILLLKFTICSIITLMLYGCSLSPFTQQQSKCTNPFIAAEENAANEMVKNGMAFSYHSTADGIRTKEGGTNWSQEFYSTDGVRVTEDFADYRSTEKAKIEFNKIVDGLKDVEVFEQINGNGDAGNIAIGIEENNKSTARIVSLGKTSVYEISAPALRYAFAFRNWKQKK